MAGIRGSIVFVSDRTPSPTLPRQDGVGVHTSGSHAGVLLGNRSNERIVFVSDRTPPRNPAGTTGRYVVSRCLLHEKAHVTILPSPSPLGSILSGLKIIDSGGGGEGVFSF